MSTRITKTNALRIANAMMEVKFVPELEKRRDEIHADTEQRLLSYIPPAVLEFSKTYPNYVVRERYHYIQNQNGMRSSITTKNDIIRLNNSDGYGKISNEDFDAIDKNRDELRALEDKFRSLRQGIMNKLVGRGVKSTCESWPEACPFIKAEMGEKEAQLPAIVNAELNAALGLPV